MAGEDRAIAHCTRWVAAVRSGTRIQNNSYIYLGDYA